MNNITDEQLQKLVKQANDIGKKGIRVKQVEIIHTSASLPDTILWVTDDGPQAASENWR